MISGRKFCIITAFFIQHDSIRCPIQFDFKNFKQVISNNVYLQLQITIIKGKNIFHSDIKPSQAQELITNQNLDLHYALKISSKNQAYLNHNNNLTNKINVTETSDKDIYEINNKNGQDGLGGYFFAYSDLNQARMEARNNKGEIRGRYKYKLNDNTGLEYSINYWADNLGFHYEDNLPKINLIPVTEEPVVKAAREEHLKKWKEAAEAAKKVYDPMSDYYNRFAIQYDEQQALLEQEREIFDGNEYDFRSLKKLKTIPNELSDQSKNIESFFVEHSYSAPIGLKLKRKF